LLGLLAIEHLRPDPLIILPAILGPGVGDLGHGDAGQGGLLEGDQAADVAVGDLLAKALSAIGKGGRLQRVTITNSLKTTLVPGGFHIPTRELVTAVALSLEGGRLIIPNALPMAGTLVEALQNFKVKVSAGGHDSYGASPGPDWREGAHDDLVLALALACWYRDRPKGVIRSF